MDELRNTENRRRQRFGKLRELFEEIQTMRLMNYSIEDMTETLQERHPDEIYFACQYLKAHKGEDIESIVKQAYEMLYSEQPPVLKPKNPEHKMKMPEVPEADRKTMLEQCTERLLKAFIRDRVEMVTCLLANNKFNVREFAVCGYDRHYIETLVRTVKLFSPTVEIHKEMLQEPKRMNAIIDRIYEELYVLTKRTKIWTCDWFDIESVRKYESKEE